MQVAGHEVIITGQNRSENEWVYLSVDGAPAVSGTKILPEVLEAIRAMPRTRTNSVGYPYVMWDWGKDKGGVKETLLGYWAQNKEEREVYNSKRGGGSSGTKVKVTERDAQVREALLTLAGTLTGKAQKELDSIIEKFFPDPVETARLAKIAQLKAQLAALGA